MAEKQSKIDTDLRAADGERDERLYEIGYHVVPIIAEEAIGEQVNAVRDAIEQAGGVIVADEMPTPVELAYPIASYIGGSKKHFSSAYLGWMQFRIAPEKVDALGKAIKETPEILRFIVTGVEDEPIRAPAGSMAFREHHGEPSQQHSSGTVSEDDLERTIEGLINE